MAFIAWNHHPTRVMGIVWCGALLDADGHRLGAVPALVAMAIRRRAAAPAAGWPSRRRLAMPSSKRRGDNGALCAAPENLCCSTACGQKCEACSMARTGQPDGTCAPVLTGQDPEGECVALGGCGTAPGKCRCEDGVKNGDETDVDCGGPTCPACGLGQTCGTPADCASAISTCVTGICCESACLGECRACTVAGICAELPAGSAHAKCAANKACGPAGSGCIGKAGTACSIYYMCLSNVCTGGLCAKSALGKPCSGTADCAAGTCQNLICQ